MIKSGLIETLANGQKHLELRDVELAVNMILDHMANELSQCGRIEIRGFAAFSVRKRPGYTARNPKTGEQVEISDRYGLHFKAGKPLLEMVNK